MHALAHRVVGVIEIESIDSFSLLPSGSPDCERATATAELPVATAKTAPPTSIVSADLHRLGVDLMIELEQFRRGVPQAC